MMCSARSLGSAASSAAKRSIFGFVFATGSRAGDGPVKSFPVLHFEQAFPASCRQWRYRRASENTCMAKD